MDINNDNFNDEFNEFGKFDPERLNELFRKKMEDEEFKRQFINIIGSYQRDFDRVMKMLYGNRGFNNHPFFNSDMMHKPNTPMGGLGFMDFDKFQEYLNKMSEEDGWTTEHWESPDGTSSYTSYSKNTEWPPNDFNPTGNIDIVQRLQNKLDEAISNENYEEAANLRDALKELKKGKEED